MALRVGRRPLLLISFGGMAACLLALSVAAAVTPGQVEATFCSLSPGERPTEAGAPTLLHFSPTPDPFLVAADRMTSTILCCGE
jgi:hypothetical protein